MKKYICIKQHDETDCGAACLATVSKQYGFTTSITKIRELAGTDKHGTNGWATRSVRMKYRETKVYHGNDSEYGRV